MLGILLRFRRTWDRISEIRFPRIPHMASPFTVLRMVMLPECHRPQPLHGLSMMAETVAITHCHSIFIDKEAEVHRGNVTCLEP